jgi:hypothetical protein
VAVGDDWSGEARDAARAAAPASYAVAQINRAEALHNLGQNVEAVQSLDALDDACQALDLALQGRAVLRAWILAHMNRTDEAATVMASVDPTPLGPRYRPEVLYTPWSPARRVTRREQSRRPASA